MKTHTQIYIYIEREREDACWLKKVESLSNQCIKHNYKIDKVPVRILMSIFLGRKPERRVPLEKPEPGWTVPMGVAPKLVPGWKGSGCS